MKVVVAGGSGLIGRHLARALLAEDHEVVVLSRRPGRAVGRLPGGVSVIEWDPRCADPSWAVQLANTAAVVNLCRGGTGPINALVDAIASLPLPDRPRALIQASSVEIYGDTAEHWLDSESAANAAERLAVRVVLLRLGIVIAGDMQLISANWVSIDDAVGLIVRAISAWDICGPTNVVAPGQRISHDKARAAGDQFPLSRCSAGRRPRR